MVNIGTGSAYANIFLSNTMLDNIDLNFKKLNVLSHEDYPWLSKVNNLYALAAFIIRTNQILSDTKRRALMNLDFYGKGFKGCCRQVDEVHHCLAKSVQFGYMQIFKDDNTKYKYDNFLS